MYDYRHWKGSWVNQEIFSHNPVNWRLYLELDPQQSLYFLNKSSASDMLHAPCYMSTCAGVSLVYSIWYFQSCDSEHCMTNLTRLDAHWALGWHSFRKQLNDWYTHCDSQEMVLVVVLSVVVLSKKHCQFNQSILLHSLSTRGDTVRNNVKQWETMWNSDK